MKPLISFIESPSMFHESKIKLIAYNYLKKQDKPFENLEIEKTSLEAVKNRIIIKYTAAIIGKAIAQRDNNYKYAGGTIPGHIYKSIDRLANLSKQLQMFSHWTQQATFIHKYMLEHLQNIAPKNRNSFPTYHGLVAHVESNFRSEITTKKAPELLFK